MIKNIENPRTEVTDGKRVIMVVEKTYLWVVDDFKHLGPYIANCHADFKGHKGQARNQFWKLTTTVWKSNQISLTVKLQLFDSHTLNYLLQLWNLGYNKSYEKRNRFLWH